MLKNDDLIYFRSSMSNRIKYFASTSLGSYSQEELINTFRSEGFSFKAPDTLQLIISRSFYFTNRLNKYNLEKRLEFLNLKTDFILYDVNNYVSCFALKFKDVLDIVDRYVIDSYNF